MEIQQYYVYQYVIDNSFSVVTKQIIIVNFFNKFLSHMCFKLKNFAIFAVELSISK